MTQVYVDGVRSADSHGEQFTDTQTRNRTTFSGAGGDDRIVVVNQPLYNGNGQNVGDRQTTTTYAHSTSEQMLRDLQHSDRSEYVYDGASGTMKLNHRTIVDQQELNNDLDVVHDIRTETETETADTVSLLVQGSTLTGVQTSHQSESDSRHRTRYHTTQTSNQITTNVGWQRGPNLAGPHRYTTDQQLPV